jgi:hypothetical protein
MMLLLLLVLRCRVSPGKGGSSECCVLELIGEPPASPSLKNPDELLTISDMLPSLGTMAKLLVLRNSMLGKGRSGSVESERSRVGGILAAESPSEVRSGNIDPASSTGSGMVAFENQTVPATS